MSPTTTALIHYWHRLPAESPALRRKSLETVVEHVREGCAPREALLPYALGDVDEGIVAAATQAYVASAGGAATAVVEAVEWVRRGLALNRGAVFGALLALEDERQAGRLAALRLLLAPEEVESACRVLAAAMPGPCALEFLQDWADLVAEGPLPREQCALRVLIDTPPVAATRARAA
jgi:hypothetical protein